ncbi:MAG: DNA mismatch repair protein MutS [Deltaproteobacteria bacterium]|nr:DNA mismatch repair protein MutS [Deltaproteobacteria bacterium]
METSRPAKLPFSDFFDENAPASKLNENSESIKIDLGEKIIPLKEAATAKEEEPAAAMTRQQLAPMMRSYLEMKKRYPEHVLLYQVGDFYEVFFEDAQLVSATLSIRLTSRDRDQENAVPMCGVPIHALDNYLPKLVQNGISCVVVNQVDEANVGKGTVKREISRIVTPGVRYEGDGLDEKSFNFLGAILCSARQSGSFVYFDVSTGQLRIEEFERAEDGAESIGRVRPSELLIPNVINGVKVERSLSWLKSVKESARQSSCHFVTKPFEKVEKEFLRERLSRLLNAKTVVVGAHKDWLSALTVESLTCLDVILSYVEEVSFGRLPFIARIQIDEKNTQAVVDQATCRNLELFTSGLNSVRQNSLVERIDFTITPMGARLLRDWLLNPSRELGEINKRQLMVKEFTERSEDRVTLRRCFLQVRDLDRIVSRIVSGRGVPRDLGNLRDSVQVLPQVKASLLNCASELGQEIAQEFDDLADIYQRLMQSLVDEPPFKINEGGIFRSGYHQELDCLHETSSNGKNYLANFEEEERRRTGISGLKVKYNNVFGYFIEISKAHIAKAPSNYERRQTLVNAERFVTPELKSFEQAVLSARAKQIELERQLFNELRDEIAAQAGRIQQLASHLAVIDLLLSFSHLAIERNYVQPEMTAEPIMEVLGGRHPVVEEVIGRHHFIGNDVYLDSGDNLFAILTGPNMGGKSTYLRQVGLIQLLAQVGSFVPAKKARLGVVDRIFTRIGSSDDISRGDSTFMVEMREAATIVRKATNRSLVLIDEIGRGTATTDGLAIATAIAEWLSDKIGARTLFATHFHELTGLAGQKKGMFCLAVGIIEQGSEIIFTHRIEQGAADRSYGIEVARLAGLPEGLLKRAQIFLAGSTNSGSPILSQSIEVAPEFDMPDYSELARRVLALDTDQLKPLEALLELNKLKEMLND